MPAYTPQGYRTKTFITITVLNKVRRNTISEKTLFYFVSYQKKKDLIKRLGSLAKHGKRKSELCTLYCIHFGRWYKCQRLLPSEGEALYFIDGFFISTTLKSYNFGSRHALHHKQTAARHSKKKDKRKANPVSSYGDYIYQTGRRRNRMYTANIY